MKIHERTDRDRSRTPGPGTRRVRTGILALTAGFLVWTAVPLVGQAPAASDGPGEGGSVPSLFLDLDSRLWVEGTSSVRDYTCEAGVVAATFRANPVDEPLSLETLEQAVRRMSLEVPAPQMDCSDDTMNKHMWEALEAEDHPQIRFELSDYRVTTQSADTATLELPGQLTLAGVKRAHAVTVRATPGADGSLRVVGSSEFEMTEFDIDPPSLMFGLMKVHPPVVVHFDLVVRIQEQETSD